MLQVLRSRRDNSVCDRGSIQWDWLNNPNIHRRRAGARSVACFLGVVRHEYAVAVASHSHQQHDGPNMGSGTGDSTGHEGPGIEERWICHNGELVTLSGDWSTTYCSSFGFLVWLVLLGEPKVQEENTQ